MHCPQHTRNNSGNQQTKNKKTPGRDTTTAGGLTYEGMHPHKRLHKLVLSIRNCQSLPDRIIERFAVQFGVVVYSDTEDRVLDSNQIFGP